MQEIKMPSAGQTTDEATIVTVHVKVGDTVKRGDVLVEAETDKAVLPVESYAAGQVLDVLVREGDVVTAGTVLAAVGSQAEAAAYHRGGTSAPAAQPPVAAAQPAVQPAAPAAKAVVGQEIKMPSAGQTTDEATIVTVRVKAGDTVKRGDVLVEAETDKAVLPVESYAAGQVLDVLVREGDTVTAGTVLAVVGKQEDAAAYHRGGAVPAAPAAPVVPAAVPTAEAEADDEYLPIIKGQTPARPKTAAGAVRAAAYPAMPNAKMLARERGIDLTVITPSNGQFIKRQDVLAAKTAAPAAMEEPPAVQAADYEVLPMSRMRTIIGRRMQESMQNIPAWQCTVSVDMEACMALRASYREKRGVKLSYNDIMAKAIAVASRKFPLVNARYEQDEVRVYRHTNVGLAVALEGALVVPVVKEIDEKGLEQIAQAYQQQIKKARDGKLAPADMGCGSITISNLGMYDVDQFIAIVNPPESCILAVGSIRVEPVWDGSAFRPVHRMSVTGSFDHRIIDGAYGAQFLQELKALMETPALMLY